MCWNRNNSWNNCGNNWNNGRNCGATTFSTAGQNRNGGGRTGNCSTCPMRNRCNAFQSGFNAGFEAGKISGWNNGYEAGRESGYQDGLESGRNSGTISCETVCRRVNNC